MSNAIAVYNFKGGVGKTSTTLSLAHSWSRSYKVLVIDGDPQSNLTSGLLKDESPPKHLSLYRLTRKLLHNELPEIEPVEISTYLHLIPGDFRMATMESNSQFISFGHIIFYKLLSAVRNQYDFILFDCPTHFGITVKSFLANVDSILIPSVPGSFSVDGFKKLLSYLSEVEREKPLALLGIFFNMLRKNTLFHRKVVKEAEQELGSLILDQRIRESIRVSEANQANRSISSSIEESDVAEDFLKLSEEVIGRMNTSVLPEIIEKYIPKETLK